jgi:hypothetical protein
MPSPPAPRPHSGRGEPIPSPQPRPHARAAISNSKDNTVPSPSTPTPIETVPTTIETLRSAIATVQSGNPTAQPSKSHTLGVVLDYPAGDLAAQLSQLKAQGVQEVVHPPRCAAQSRGVAIAAGDGGGVGAGVATVAGEPAPHGWLDYRARTLSDGGQRRRGLHADGARRDAPAAGGLTARDAVPAPEQSAGTQQRARWRPPSATPPRACCCCTPSAKTPCPTCGTAGTPIATRCCTC